MRKNRAKTIAVASIGLLGTAVITGCVPSDPTRSRCREASPALVRGVMSGAIENGRPTPSATYIDHIEDDGGYVGSLPSAEQRFGATQVLGLRVTTYFGGPDASDSIPGVVGSALFFLDDRDRVLGAVLPIDNPTFGITTPDDPDFVRWADRSLGTSRGVDAVLQCLEP